jgi:hypothetical protein
MWYCRGFLVDGGGKTQEGRERKISFEWGISKNRIIAPKPSLFGVNIDLMLRGIGWTIWVTDTSG